MFTDTPSTDLENTMTNKTCAFRGCHQPLHYLDFMQADMLSNSIKNIYKTLCERNTTRIEQHVIAGIGIFRITLERISDEEFFGDDK